MNKQIWTDYPVGRFVLQFDTINIYLGSFIVSIASFIIAYILSRLLFGNNYKKRGVAEISMLLCVLFTLSISFSFLNFRWSFLLGTLIILISSFVYDYFMHRIVPLQVAKVLEEKHLLLITSIIIIVFVAFYRISITKHESLFIMSFSYSKFMWILSSIALGMYLHRIGSKAIGQIDVVDKNNRTFNKSNNSIKPQINLSDEEISNLIIGKWKGSNILKGITINMEITFLQDHSCLMRTNTFFNGSPVNIDNSGKWKITKGCLICYYKNHASHNSPDVDSPIILLNENELKMQERDSISTLFRQHV